MRVQELMTRDPSSCAPETRLAEAARLMWEGDCGILPVVAEGGRVVGLVTDRDICMASMMNPEPVTEIPVSRVITGEVYACGPETEVRDALRTMREHRVRRLPVVNEEGRLEGVLSLNDVALEAREGPDGGDGPTYADLAATMKAVCAHRDLPQAEARPAASAQAATG